MATPFDFGKLLDNPAFRFGSSILGNSHRPGVIGDAFSTVDKLSAMRQQTEENKQLMERHAQQMAAAQQLRAQQEADLAYRREDMERKRAEAGAVASRAAAQDKRSQALMEAAMRHPALRGLIDPSMLGEGAPPAPPEPDLQPPASGPAAPPQGMVIPPGMSQDIDPAIINSLAQAESSGNPRAMGPPVPSHGGARAQGLMQFMPSTVDMLAKRGLQFDPMNGEHAKVAGNLYLSDLQKRNGSLERGLAAYGGFKNKDPSAYIRKVLGGAKGAPQNPQQPQSGMDDATSLQMLGAIGELAGEKSFKALGTMGKALEPRTIPAGSYQQSATGQREFIQDPYRERTLGIQGEQLKLDQRKADEESTRRGQEAAAADTKSKKMRAEDQGAFRNVDASMQRMENAVNSLENHPGLDSNVGVKGALQVYKIPNTAGRDASSILDSIKSKLVIETVKELKAASATGSTGFGSITEPENKRFETMIANLDRSQSKDGFLKQLREIKGFVSQIRARALGEYRATYNEDPNPKSDAGGSAMSLDDYIRKHRK